MTRCVCPARLSATLAAEAEVERGTLRIENPQLRIFPILHSMPHLSTKRTIILFSPAMSATVSAHDVPSIPLPGAAPEFLTMSQGGLKRTFGRS